VWSTDTWACERILEGHNGDVRHVVVRGDKLNISSFDNTIKVWSTDTWACERTLDGHDDHAAYLVMHGDKLLSGSDDYMIKVWNTDYFQSSLRRR
jgi:WD40 repeat protein